jgi:hypothetical protein
MVDVTRRQTQMVITINPPWRAALGSLVGNEGQERFSKQRLFRIIPAHSLLQSSASVVSDFYL